MTDPLDYGLGDAPGWFPETHVGNTRTGVPWEEVALRYITSESNESLRTIAKELGIGTKSVELRSSAGRWVEKRRAYRAELMRRVSEEEAKKALARRRKLLAKADDVQERGLTTSVAVLGLKQQQLGLLIRQLEAAPDQAAKDAILAAAPIDVLDAYRAIKTAQEARVWAAEIEERPSTRQRHDVLTLRVDDLLGGPPKVKDAEFDVLEDEDA